MNVRSTISFFFKFFHQQQLSHYQRRVHSSIHVEEVMCWRKIMLSFPPEVETLQASVREVRSTFWTLPPRSISFQKKKSVAAGEWDERCAMCVGDMLILETHARDRCRLFIILYQCRPKFLSTLYLIRTIWHDLRMRLAIVEKSHKKKCSCLCSTTKTTLICSIVLSFGSINFNIWLVRLHKLYLALCVTIVDLVHD